MANATPIALGQQNLAGQLDTLYLKVWAGEILAAFNTANVTLDKHKIRTITAGKSASFPATWKLTASYHTPGNEIVGQTSAVSERVITIDDMLTAPFFIADIDDAKNHYDVRAEYTSKAGIALANRWDNNIMRVGALAAQASATVTGGNGGTALTSATTLYRTSAVDLAAGIYAARQALLEKDNDPNEPVYGYMKPAQYFLLAQSTALLNRDWTYGDSPNGNYAEGNILKIGGVNLVMTNNLPQDNLTTGPTAYQGDMTKVAAVIMTREAVGTVKLKDLAFKSEYQLWRLGTLFVAMYAVGHGILRPEAAAVLKTTT